MLTWASLSFTASHRRLTGVMYGPELINRIMSIFILMLVD
jgi:hypothetical protein